MDDHHPYLRGTSEKQVLGSLFFAYGEFWNAAGEGGFKGKHNQVPQLGALFTVYFLVGRVPLLLSSLLETIISFLFAGGGRGIPFDIHPEEWTHAPR